MGPSLDLVMRRTRFAGEDLAKAALKQPKQLKPRKVKNIERSPLGDAMGRLHMEKQEIGKIQTRKIKGLKKRKGEDDAGAAGAASPADGGRKKPRHRRGGAGADDDDDF